MPILYSISDKDGWIISPNFTRMRHRYRGPRESYKFNYEMSAFLYEINKSYAFDKHNIEYLEDSISKLISGYDFDTTIKTSSKYITIDTSDGSLPGQRRLRYRGHIPYRIHVDYWGRSTSGENPETFFPYNLPINYNNPDKDYRGRDI